MAKAEVNKKILFASQLDLHLRTKLKEFYIWSVTLYGTKTWTLRNTDQKALKSFQMWCWRRMEIGWTDSVEKIKKYYMESMKKGTSYTKNKANSIGQILRWNRLLKHVIEANTKRNM
jgi:hypothetical protein